MLQEEPLKDWYAQLVKKWAKEKKPSPEELSPVNIPDSPIVKKPPIKRWISAGGVVIPSMQDRERVYVAKPSNNYGPWTFPKGRVDEGETKEQAAKREVWEEIGIRAKIIDSEFSYLGTGKGSFSITHFWLMVKTGGSPRINDEMEEIRLVTWREAKQLFRSSGNRRDSGIADRAIEALKKIQ